MRGRPWLRGFEPEQVPPEGSPRGLARRQAGDGALGSRRSLVRALKPGSPAPDGGQARQPEGERRGDAEHQQCIAHGVQGHRGLQRAGRQEHIGEHEMELSERNSQQPECASSAEPLRQHEQQVSAEDQLFQEVAAEMAQSGMCDLGPAAPRSSRGMELRDGMRRATGGCAHRRAVRPRQTTRHVGV